MLLAKHTIPSGTVKEYKISIFVPVFNEERIIDREIRMIDSVIKKLPVGYEIFVVNDASKDRTRAIAQRIEQVNKKVTLLNYEKGPTRRENLARSFKQAQGDIVIFVDVDLIVSLRFLSDLIGQVISGYDIVTGSRYIIGSKIRRKPFRLLFSIIYNGCIRLLFRTHIRDHMCGFKAFRKDVILKLVEEIGYDESLTRGIFWDVELLITARRHGYRIKEIPIWWKEREKSALNPNKEIKTIGYVLKFVTRSVKEKVYRFPIQKGA